MESDLGLNSHSATSSLCDLVPFVTVASSDVPSLTSKPAPVLTKDISFVPWSFVFSLFSPKASGTMPPFADVISPTCRAFCHLARLQTPTSCGPVPSLWDTGFATCRTELRLPLGLCHLMLAITLARFFTLAETSFLKYKVG